MDSYCSRPAPSTLSRLIAEYVLSVQAVAFRPPCASHVSWQKSFASSSLCQRSASPELALIHASPNPSVTVEGGVSATQNVDHAPGMSL